MVAELLSSDRLEVVESSVAWPESSSESVYLAPSFQVCSSSMSQSSQFSPAQPLVGARPSVVAKLPLLYWFDVTEYSAAWSESSYMSPASSFEAAQKPVKPSSQLSAIRARRSVAVGLLSLYHQSRMSK